ncbi:hypothetical protein GCM10010266_43100 [Streptomyces griseomycini]|nr:hypothetical protein GCM10010266_43100 [Streptomyces griseomycini]
MGTTAPPALTTATQQPVRSRLTDAVASRARVICAITGACTVSYAVTPGSLPTRRGGRTRVSRACAAAAAVLC